MKITVPIKQKLNGILAISWAMSGLLISSCQAQSTIKKTVPFRYVKNQILIEIKLDKEGGNLYMLLDTGVDPSVIDYRTAEAYDLKVETDDEGVAEGRGTDKVKVYPTVLDELYIGNEKFNTIEALAFDMSGLAKKLGSPIHGILGYSFIKGKIFRIDYQNKEIQFFESEEGLDRELSDDAIRLSFETDGEDMIPILGDFKVNGHEFMASLDTGSSLNIQIYRHRLGDVQLDSLNMDKLKSSALYGAQGKKETYTTTIDLFELGDALAFKNQELTISTIKNKKQLRMGNIGNRFLENFRVSFDYINKKVVFEPKS